MQSDIKWAYVCGQPFCKFFVKQVFFLLRLLRSCGLVGREVYSFNSCILAKGASKADSFTHFILLASLCSQWLEKFKQKVCFYGTQPPLDRTKCNASKSKKPIKSLEWSGARQIAIWMYLRPYARGACCTSQIYWLAPRPKKRPHSSVQRIRFLCLFTTPWNSNLAVHICLSLFSRTVLPRSPWLRNGPINRRGEKKCQVK